MIHVKNNFKNMYKDKPNGLNCSLCLKECETQLHAVICDKLPRKFPYPYENLFSEKEDIFIPALKAYEKIWNLREDLLLP